MTNNISIIIPCFNEGKNIYENIIFLDVYLKKYLKNSNIEFILVNDGSYDNTSEEINKINSKIESTKIVDYKKNMGKGFAIKQGLEKAQGDIIAFYDADLDVEPISLVKHINHLNKNNKIDIVIASKEHKKSKVSYSMSRVIISKTNILLNKILFGIPIKDTQTGLKVFRKELKNIFLKKVKTFGYAFDVEFLYNIYTMGYKIKELPVRIAISEGTGVNFISILHYIRELLIFQKKTRNSVNYLKIGFLTKLKLFGVRLITFPLENIIRFFLYIKTKKVALVKSN